MPFSVYNHRSYPFILLRRLSYMLKHILHPEIDTYLDTEILYIEVTVKSTLTEMHHLKNQRFQSICITYVNYFSFIYPEMMNHEGQISLDINPYVCKGLSNSSI